ncbi:MULTISPECIES: helix-turn-helix domain-containing protein [unclassified Streptomyces]|uniref:helix-turn-helix domain-containing protein n=1 Tax=unclassified Streptomyces TaxID=2593676 RepID=UPI000DAD8272|nr:MULTISPECIES: helix-turn-helix transcriptional regulator [unclassified Streptomyces]PZT76722.1 XRE family transcriptional regulator [Streptomyces sp. AC1-42W]PZT79323.1 XRE family transcriptional regulator [Streptomyces sp. AC1-42T]
MPITYNPTIRQRRLARTLRDLRLKAGLKHSDAAEVLGCAESKMTRIENAQSGIRLLDLRALLDAYNVTNGTQRAEIEKLSRDAKRKGWWAQYGNLVDSAYAAYIAIESDASEIYDVETSLIPGLLQTPAYTEAVIKVQVPDASDEHISTMVKVREERRKVLGGDNPIHLRVILSESILRHAVGSAEVMREQLEHLLAAGEETNVELQILPGESALNAALFGPFVIMGFPSSSESDVAYAESTTGTVYYEEKADTEKYRTLFRRLNVAACDVSKSRALIRRAIAETADK